jgi:hypothetical protein
LKPDQTLRLGIADGRYSFSLRKSGWSTNNETAQRFGQLLDLDAGKLSEIEIQGQMKELPIHARLSEEIKLLEPAPGASVDLRKDFFRWTPVRGASHYLIQLGYHEDTPQHSTYYGIGGGKSPSTNLCLGSSVLPDWNLEQIRKRLIPGRTGTWSVEAFDASGRRIGTSLGNARPFFVAHGLEEQ